MACYEDLRTLCAAVCKERDELKRQLGKYEEAAADGRLLIAPCKVGDTVWAFNTYHAKDASDGKKVPASKARAVQGRVSEMYYTDEMRLIVRVKNICVYGFWGENVFATKEEAEAKLEGRDG